MYSMQVGVLLELFCFTIAVALRVQREIKERERLNQALLEKQAEMEAKDLRLKKKEDLQLALQANGEKHPSEFAQKVLAAIGLHLSDPMFGVEELAKAMHLSRVQLHRRVTEETGETASHLILQARLTKATHLLLHTDLPIAQIAWDCGVSEQGYFAKVFKKETGKSPRELRKKE